MHLAFLAIGVVLPLSSTTQEIMCGLDRLKLFYRAWKSWLLILWWPHYAYLLLGVCDTVLTLNCMRFGLLSCVHRKGQTPNWLWSILSQLKLEIGSFWLQTVAPQDATSFAKPLKSQPVNKSRIWGLFLLGATALFGGAVALERNSSFFPAISKANQALAATKEAQKVNWTCLSYYLTDFLLFSLAAGVSNLKMTW